MFILHLLSLLEFVEIVLDKLRYQNQVKLSFSESRLSIKSGLISQLTVEIVISEQ